VDRNKRGRIRDTFIFLVACSMIGCASVPDQLVQVPSAVPPIEAQKNSVLAAIGSVGNKPASARKEQTPTGPTKNIQKDTPVEDEEPYDPFKTEAERALEEEYDPWEPFNVVMFEFNRKFDKYVLKPVAKVYDKILPDELERGISNAFHNVRFVPRLINNLLQGKLKGAGLEAGRFVINSSLGIGGLFDVAKNVFGMVTPDEDTGQTLGAYGIKPGPYLVLPLLPPLTLRDAFGYAGDYLLDPINYFVFAVVRVGQPALVTHQTTANLAWLGMRAGEIINERSINLETFQGVEESTVDLYGAVRNAYLQRRVKQIRE
jgi:phospholipid-binding lipoprotein MlaA